MEKPNLMPCKDCPFTDNGINLDPTYFAEVQTYLIAGDNHFCHTSQVTEKICRGGRSFQLEMWYRLKRIEEPTEDSLKSAMMKAGILPGNHI